MTRLRGGLVMLSMLSGIVPGCTDKPATRASVKSGGAIAADPALPASPPPRAPAAPSEPPAPAPIAAAPPAPARRPSFRREIMPYFAHYCASARGCHGNNKNKHVDLDLRPFTAYRHLVNAPSDERIGAMLVRPGDPDASFVVAKLLGKLRDKEGTAMPRDEQDDRPVSPIPFDPDFIDNALVPWIRAGAPNN